MFRSIVEAILYNSYGMELDRKTLDDTNIQYSLVKIIEEDWVLNDGDTIKIKTRDVEF